MGISEREALENFNFESLPTDKLVEYMTKEAEWIDSVFAEHWSWIVVRFARWQNERLAKGKAPNFLMRLAIFIFARISGLEIARNKHMNMLGGKGFRPGRQVVQLDRITVTVKKHGREVAKKDFKLTAIIPN